MREKPRHKDTVPLMALQEPSARPGGCDSSPCWCGCYCQTCLLWCTISVLAMLSDCPTSGAQISQSDRAGQACQRSSCSISYLLHDFWGNTYEENNLQFISDLGSVEWPDFLKSSFRKSWISRHWYLILISIVAIVRLSRMQCRPLSITMTWMICPVSMFWCVSQIMTSQSRSVTWVGV